MSFTEEIKNEIISQPVKDENYGLIMLSAFIRTSSSVISKNGAFGFEIITENAQTGEFFTELLDFLFDLHAVNSSAKFDLLKNKDKLVYEYLGEAAENLLIKLGIVGVDGEGKFLNFGISDNFVLTEEHMSAYLKGAFLGGGSCTLPDEIADTKTGYHFEIVFSNKFTAEDFCEILAEFEILSKLVARKESAVVYVKSKEVISDLLNFMGCNHALESLGRVVESREEQNNANRAVNCSVSNLDKTVTASVNQVRAIETIAQTIGLKALEKPLFEVATCRLLDKNASMQELSSRLKITKSCLNHRMRKILEIAKSLGQD